MLPHLPIDKIIPQLLSTLSNSKAIVIQAPPGSGKTSRVPLSLLKAAWLSGQKIIMLEPRRLAATNAARWMAGCLGEEVGKSVGYRIRFEKKVGTDSRIEVVTEGVFIKLLQRDPMLNNIGVVIFDEFHERNLASDLALALCLDIQSGVRDDLRLVVMSATLDTVAVAKLLCECPVLETRGKSFPVSINYLSKEMTGDTAEIAARSVQMAIGETEGDILVFLPGTREIRRCQRLLASNGTVAAAVDIAPLYGDLPFAAQERAILPGSRRKVVLATNIAETSITINGVSVVIDSGWSRQLRFDPATGLNRLVTVRVSAASASQRAGRAGRLGPGICYRLWTEHRQSILLSATPPEIISTDLAPLLIELANWGVADPAALSWLDPPPAAALAEGRRLLQSLGAFDNNGKITPLGRAMAALPLHPRLAKMILAGKERKQGAVACDLAALLSERDILRGATHSAYKEKSRSDIEDRLDLLVNWRKGVYRGDRKCQVDQYACREVDRIAAQLRRLVGVQPSYAEGDNCSIGLMLAWAYPDRVALQRDSGSARYLLANGRGATLSQRSAVSGEPLIVAVECDGGVNGDALIHAASSFSLDELRREFATLLVRERVIGWDELQNRVVALEEERYNALVLESRSVKHSLPEIKSALLQGIARHGGAAALNWSTAARDFQSRVIFMARVSPLEGWPDLSDSRLSQSLAEWLLPWLDGIGGLADLVRVDIMPALRALLTWEQSRRLEEGAPTHVVVPSGSRVKVTYPVEGMPILAVKLQELFGLADTPTVAWGKVPVILHLLSPAGRPIQITQDLRNFWDIIYPEVKKELKGRYPKHPWPNDPWNAVPTRHAKKRGV